MKKKELSIAACNGIISPSLLVPARIAIQQGLTVLYDEKEISIDDSLIDKMLAVADGQNRIEILKEINKERIENKNAPIENYYYFPLIKDYDVLTLIQESNVATAPWQADDFNMSVISKIQAYRKNGGLKEEVNEDKIVWVQEKGLEGSLTSAWMWSMLRKEKYPTKTTLMAAAKGDEAQLLKIAKRDRFEDGKALFELIKGKVGLKFATFAPVPEYIIKRLESLINPIEGDKVEYSVAIQMLKDFIRSITVHEGEVLSSHRTKNNIKRETKIYDDLDVIWNRYISKKDEQKNEEE